MARVAGVSAADTRRRLVDAAARVFEVKGFEGATIAQIAEEAGVTSGAIYNHYPSKAELLADALRSHGGDVGEKLFPRESHVDAAGVLAALANRIASGDPDDTALLAEGVLAARRDARLAEVMREVLGESESVLEAVVVDGQDQGVLAPHLPARAVARFALMVGLGSMVLSDLDLDPIDSEEWALLIGDLLGGPGTGAPRRPS